MTMNDDKLNMLQIFLFILLAVWLPLSLTLSQTFYFLAFVVWIAAIAAKKKRPLRYTKLEIPVIVLAIAYILAILFSPSPLESVRILKKLAPFGLFFLLANTLNSEAQKGRLINFWLLGAIIASVWTAIEYLRGVSRPGGFFGCMTFGHFALTFLGISLSLMGSKDYKLTCILARSAFAVGVLALLFTCTRGAWIGFIAGLILFYIIKQKWLFLAASGVVLVLIFSILFIYFPDSGPGKGVRSLVSPFDKQVPRVAASNLRRWYKWKASWMMFKEHPLFGIGPYRFEEELPNYLSEQVWDEVFKNQDYSHAHNIYLDALATMGITGFSGLLFSLSAVFYLLISKYKCCNLSFEKALVLGALIAFTSFCVGGLTNQCFHRSQVLLNLCFLLGLVL